MADFQRVTRHGARTDDELVANPRLDIYYEDLITDRRGVLRAVGGFLGLATLPRYGDGLPPPRRSRRELIANYEALRAGIAGLVEAGQGRPFWLEFCAEAAGG